MDRRLNTLISQHDSDQSHVHDQTQRCWFISGWVVLFLVLAACSSQMPGSPQPEAPDTQVPTPVSTETVPPLPTRTRVPRTVFVRPTTLAEGSTAQALQGAQITAAAQTQLAGLATPIQTEPTSDALPTAFVFTATAGPTSTPPNPRPSATTRPNGATNTPTRTPSSTATLLPLPTINAPRLSRIQFFTRQAGWGLADGYILRTENGGVSWHDVSPVRMDEDDPLAGFFLNEQTAWLLRTTENNTTGILYRTSDAGRLWRTSSLPAPKGLLYFNDLQTGWFMAQSTSGAAMPVQIFRTSDGGANWSEVHASQSGSPPPTGSLPDSGVKNGFVFSEATRGWISGGLNTAASTLYFYTSADSGLNWYPVIIPIPTEYLSPILTTFHPYFFPNSSGSLSSILPVRIFTGTYTTLLYRSTDNGLTWLPTREVNLTGEIDCPTVQYCFVYSGSTLAYTNDGGNTWAVIMPELNLSNTLRQIDFVTSSLGYALERDSGGNARIYRTEDGGFTWTIVP